MDIPSDIACRIKTIFPASEHSQALALVSTATLHDGQLANPQCLRCAVQASKGSLQELVYYIDLLKLDFRDVIVAGEYQLIDARLTRVRDLTEPFDWYLDHPDAVRDAHPLAVTDDSIERQTADVISSMTDRFALRTWERLFLVGHEER